MRKTLALLVLWLVATNGLASSISITDSTAYTQDFDTLATSGTSVTWENGSTLAGWSLFRKPKPGTVITAYAASTGSLSQGGGFPGGFYSFGIANNSDRALGGVGSGGDYFGNPGTDRIAGWMAVSLVNNSGSTINSFSITYDGEQWRDGGNDPAVSQTMVMEVGFGSSFTTVSSWTAPGSAFNFTSPVYTTTGAAVNGNVAGRVAGIGGMITSPSPWNSGDTLWIRWIEWNNSHDDHGLALDNFRFAAIVPEPSTFALVGLSAAALLFSRRRQ